MARRTSLLLAVLASVLTLAVGFFGGLYLEQKTSRGTPYVEMEDLIREKYVDPNLKEVDLVRGCFDGMARSLNDKPSVYMPPTDAQEWRRHTAGNLAGIGVVLGNKDGQLIIESVMAGGAASAANLQAGDVIETVNGVPADGNKIGESRGRLVGNAGTTVKVVIRRPGEKDARQLELVRKSIIPESVVVTEVTRNGRRIVHLRLNSFDMRTKEDFALAMMAIMARRPDGIVLDLRDNGGGLVNSAMFVAGAWIGEAVGFRRFDRSGGPYSAHAYGRPILSDIPTALLVNGSTASASEMLAGALQDYGKARVFGEKTYGKGSIQIGFDLEDGGMMKLTIERWVTPKGRPVNGVGLMPDEIVKPHPCDGKTCSAQDVQLDRAVEWLITPR